MRNPEALRRGPWLPPLDGVVQYEGAPGYVVFTLPCPKRLRVIVGGETVADTTRGLILFESDHLPVYYWPLEDVRRDLLAPSAHETRCPWKGVASYYDIAAGGRVARHAVWHYRAPIAACPPIGAHVGISWSLVDRVLEEEEEVFGHPRDPFRRVDCLPSRRRVEVIVAGETVASSADAVFLYETGHPPRYYLPPADVRQDLLVASARSSRCPYKGEAAYFGVRAGGGVREDVAWTYRAPFDEARRIAGRIAFWQERIDAILVDGVAAPLTPMA